MYATYKKALKLSVKKAKVKLLEAKISKLKESVRAEIDAATEVIESLDDNMKKTVRTVKNELWSSFDLYDSKVNDYLELKVKCQEADDDDDDSSAVLMEHTAILKEVKAVSTELEAIAASDGSVL